MTFAFLRDAWLALTAWFSSLTAVGWLVLSAIIEAVFFFTYGFVAGPIKQKIVETIIVVGALMSQQSASATTSAVQTGQSVISLLAATPGVSQYLWRLLWLHLFLLAAGFSIYCVFHGTLWLIASRRSRDERREHRHAHHAQHVDAGHPGHGAVGANGLENHSWPVFVARFAWISIWWLLLVIVYEVVGLLFTLRSAVAGEGTSGGAGPIVLSVIVAVLLLVAAWSYAMPLRESGRRGFFASFAAVVRHWRVSVPVTFLLVAVFAALNYTIVALSFFGEWLWLIAGAVLFVIVLAWARLYLLLSVQRMGLEGDQEDVRLKEARHVGP